MKKYKKILIVDDDKAHRTMLKTLISEWGFIVFEADDGKGAVDEVKKNAFDLILMDIRMIKMSGIEALVKIKEINSAINVIIMTAYSSVETAVKALKNGAYDYIEKPIDFEKLKISLQRASERSELIAENKELKKRLKKRFDSRNIIFQSKKMLELMETVSMVAPSEATVLIAGESGTGKELIAEAVHYNSSRKDKSFIKINCGAVSESLLESELFGHEKGAFTGADKKKKGCFSLADGGSIFLDEVSETSLNMQVKLLRVLQEKEIMPVGSEKIYSIDVRIIAASNKNLEELVQKGLFREDLYYRLNVVKLEIPALRERKEDIPLLAQHFLEIFKDRNNKQINGLSQDTINLLMQYDWQGNVRELMNAMERAVVLSLGEYIDESLFAFISEKNDPFFKTKENEEIIPLEEIEKKAILKAMKMVSGNKSEAARKLGITRKTLAKKLKIYG
jgi:two-component system, NtrC family, response regulator HydG